MVHKVHERLGNSVDSPLEGVEEVSQVHRVLYLHGGGGDDDDDDIYDNFDNNDIYLWYTLPPSSADGWSALPSWRGCCHPGGKFFFYYHHPGGYQETSIETYLEISYCLKRQCTDLQAIFSSLVYGKTSTNHHLVEN